MNIDWSYVFKKSVGFILVLPALSTLFILHPFATLVLVSMAILIVGLMIIFGVT